MQLDSVQALLALSVCLGIAGICYGIAAAAASISRRKGRLRLMGCILFGSAICVAGISMFLAQDRLHVYQAEGIIDEVQVHPEGKDYRTEVHLQTSSGATLSLHAHGRSSYFRPGEHAALNYRELTGGIVKARFIAADGKGEGVFSSTDSWVSGAAFLAGLFVMWAGCRVNKRNPEGLEESNNRGFAPYDSFDNASLLHLSDSDDSDQHRGLPS